MERSFKNVSNTIDPHAWDNFLGDKNSSEYHAYIGFYLCAKKVWNIISDHFTLKMSKKDSESYQERLKQSSFFTSLVFIIKKYFDRTLTVEYANNLLTFRLVDDFGNAIDFQELSDGEQSLLSMIFTMYGYDLNYSMLFVDEPEIHFHPQMQRSFARMIEKINQNI